jgi:hypothetical protein
VFLPKKDRTNKNGAEIESEAKKRLVAYTGVSPACLVCRGGRKEVGRRREEGGGDKEGRRRRGGGKEGRRGG